MPGHFGNKNPAMRWANVCLETVAYELPVEAVSTASIEQQLGPTYQTLKLQTGQVEMLTGIRERRMWPKSPGPVMAQFAARAAEKALAQAGVSAKDLGAVVYAGVCRDQLEPATACGVAEIIGASPEAVVFDVSNACLGVLNGMVEIANRIELGQMQAGLIVSCESSREIIDSTIARLNGDANMERFRLSLATFTGGSGAVAVVLTRAGFSDSEHRLISGASLSAPEFNRLCRWGPSKGLLGETPNVMNTDAAQVLEHGVALGKSTWERFLKVNNWARTDVDKVICHQVGAGHRSEVLRTLGIDESRDFSTFETLGNIGTVSVPLTLAMAHEQGFLHAGDRVGLLGIGSGLNCLMLGVQW